MWQSVRHEKHHSQLSKRLGAPYVRDVMARFRAQEISGAEAAGELQLGRSQFYRLWTDYLQAVGEDRQDGWEPGVSGGDHHSTPWSPEVEALCERLLGGQPPCSYSLVASEVLRRGGVHLDRATVRRWAIEHNLAPDTRWKERAKPQRRWQTQKVGQLWQYDVSPHRWFVHQEQLPPLFDILDDCSRVITGAQLYPRETLLAHLDFLSQTLRRAGLPLALYVDYHSFFFSQHPEQLTQLAAALLFYGVSLRYAPTPQAKGKVERLHQFWQYRLPPLLAAEGIEELRTANPFVEELRVHHNQSELHRELGCTPQAAWDRAVQEGRTVWRPPPACPWWPYVFSLRTSLKVGRDGRIPIGTERLRIDCSPGVRVIRCLHPQGDISVLLHPPIAGRLPLVLWHLSAGTLSQPFLPPSKPSS
jgi:hypothetical protein